LDILLFKGKLAELINGQTYENNACISVIIRAEPMRELISLIHTAITDIPAQMPVFSSFNNGLQWP